MFLLHDQKFFRKLNNVPVTIVRRRLKKNNSQGDFLKISKKFIKFRVTGSNIFIEYRIRI